jgi:hypothetical protein
MICTNPQNFKIFNILLMEVIVCCTDSAIEISIYPLVMNEAEETAKFVLVLEEERLHRDCLCLCEALSHAASWLALYSSQARRGNSQCDYCYSHYDCYCFRYSCCCCCCCGCCFCPAADASAQHGSVPTAVLTHAPAPELQDALWGAPKPSPLVISAGSKVCSH